MTKNLRWTIPFVALILSIVGVSSPVAAKSLPTKIVTPSGSPPNAPKALHFTAAAVLPGALSVMTSLVANYRGAFPKKMTTLTSPGDADTAAQVKDVYGSYIVSQSAFNGSTTDSVLHMVVGTKLTSWVVNTATGAEVYGPTTVTGTALPPLQQVKPPPTTTTTAAATSNVTPKSVLPDRCTGYVYAPYLEWNGIFGYLIDGYAYTKCNTLVDLTQSQRLQQYGLDTQSWRNLPCCNLVITEPVAIKYHEYDAYAPCENVGQTRKFRQYMGILVLYLDSGLYGGSSGYGRGRNNPCQDL